MEEEEVVWDREKVTKELEEEEERVMLVLVVVGLRKSEEAARVVGGVS